LKSYTRRTDVVGDNQVELFALQFFGGALNNIFAFCGKPNNQLIGFLFRHGFQNILSRLEIENERFPSVLFNFFLLDSLRREIPHGGCHDQ
jgi:hypothetical protein